MAVRSFGRSVSLAEEKILKICNCENEDCIIGAGDGQQCLGAGSLEVGGGGQQKRGFVLKSDAGSRTRK